MQNNEKMWGTSIQWVLLNEGNGGSKERTCMHCNDN